MPPLAQYLIRARSESVDLVAHSVRGTTGSLAQIAPSAEQSHILYPSIDLFLSPDWEFTAGYGVKLSVVGEE